MTNMTAEHANRRLVRATAVVSAEDGELGHIRSVCTFRRNGVDAWSYRVDTQYGLEIWDAGECVVLDPRL